MARMRSFSVMRDLFLRDFLALEMEFLIKSSAAPEGIPRPLAWSFRICSASLKGSFGVVLSFFMGIFTY